MKIVCIGNPFFYPDNFGMEIYKRLTKRGIEAIEGGLGGLSLLPYFEEDEAVLVVDHGVGFDQHFCTKEEVVISVERYEHATAFYYLLSTLEKADIFFYLSNRLWKVDELEEDVQRILAYAAKL